MMTQDEYSAGFADEAPAETNDRLQLVRPLISVRCQRAQRIEHRAPRIQSNLRGFMALVSQCDSLVCSDSGPMHIAGATHVIKLEREARLKLHLPFDI